ncbi:MAG TPA: hypothetical protein PK583_00120 [Gammaproteobacteria bacterium]|nr:hypothetical protein [Gammaproteobacteria bacterium]
MLMKIEYTRREGVDIVTKRDSPRLEAQMIQIKAIMDDGRWHTLGEIEQLTGHPQASISAQIRHLRKLKFGSHIIDRRYLSDGLYEYRLRKDGELGI